MDGMLGGLGIVGGEDGQQRGCEQEQQRLNGDDDDEEVVRPTPVASSSSPPKLVESSTSSSSSKKLRVRRSTFVPGWAVPPRVLLVDDDAVSRKLSSKFLQVFGCTTDVAVDGVAAVNKMNLEKYDLVLMVSSLFFFFLPNFPQP
jgi:osomolarity two-component system response regulator SKN7